MRLPVRAAALLALTLATFPALADQSSESGGDESERPIRIGARRAQPSFPNPRDVLSQVTDRLASTMPTLLEGLPGLTLVESLPLGGTPLLRGLTGRRVAVLVDGLRLENSLTPLAGDDLLGLIDPLSVSRVELLRGLGSVAHGSGAVGGAIDLLRQRLSPDPSKAWDARADFRGGFDSGRLGAFGRLAAAGEMRGIGVRASAGLKRFGDLQSGRGGGREEFTAATEARAELEAGWAPRRGSYLLVSYDLLRQPDLPRPDRSRWDHFQLLARDRDVVRADYVADDVSRWVGSMQATVRYRHERMSRDLYDLGEDVISGSHERVAGLDALLTLASELSSHRLSYGVDVNHEWVASTALLEAISSDARALSLTLQHPDGSTALHAEAFFLDQVALGSRFSVELGARGGLVNVAPGRGSPTAPPGAERRLASYASSLKARYLLGDGLNLVAGVGQGFLAPNLDDLAASGCHERGFRLPSPNLNPERNVSGELGVKFDLYGVLTGSVFYSYTHLLDAMVEVPLEGAWVDCGGAHPAPALKLENSTARVHSLDASVQLEFSRWKLVSWMSWARGSRDLDPAGDSSRGTVPLDSVPPLSGYAAARYQFTRVQSFLELALRWVAPQDRLGNADRLDRRLCSNPGGTCAGSPSYFFVSVRGGMELLRWLKLNLALENLTHERYRVYAAGVPAPGFSGLLGVEVMAP